MGYDIADITNTAGITDIINQVTMLCSPKRIRTIFEFFYGTDYDYEYYT